MYASAHARDPTVRRQRARSHPPRQQCPRRGRRERVDRRGSRVDPRRGRQRAYGRDAHGHPRCRRATAGQGGHRASFGTRAARRGRVVRGPGGRRGRRRAPPRPDRLAHRRPGAGRHDARRARAGPCRARGGPRRRGPRVRDPRRFARRPRARGACAPAGARGGARRHRRRRAARTRRASGGSRLRRARSRRLSRREGPAPRGERRPFRRVGRGLRRGARARARSCRCPRRARGCARGDGALVGARGASRTSRRPRRRPGAVGVAARRARAHVRSPPR